MDNCRRHFGKAKHQNERRKFEEKPRIRNAYPYVCFFFAKQKATKINLARGSSNTLLLFLFLLLRTHPPVFRSNLHTHFEQWPKKKDAANEQQTFSLKRKMSQCQNELHIFFLLGQTVIVLVFVLISFVCDCFSTVFSSLTLFRLFMSTADIST